MRSFLVIVTCLFLAGPAMAQSHSDAECLDLSELAGQPIGVFWANSFSVFLEAQQSELADDQIKLVREAIEFGLSLNSKMDDSLSIHTMKGLMGDARKVLTTDQFSSILAGMGGEKQEYLATIGVIAPEEIACSCDTTGERGPACPEGFTCTVGCTTHGTGEWNGLCKRGNSDDN